jgi:hypothetical protein
VILASTTNSTTLEQIVRGGAMLRPSRTTIESVQRDSHLPGGQGASTGDDELGLPELILAVGIMVILGVGARLLRRKG